MLGGRQCDHDLGGGVEDDNNDVKDFEDDDYIAPVEKASMLGGIYMIMIMLAMVKVTVKMAMTLLL